MSNDKWAKAQRHEAEYWGDCLGMTAWGEFYKQTMYGREMGLFTDFGDGHGELNMEGLSVLDIGGGPVSMTLRCYNNADLVVVDPLDWPASVHRRYGRHGIRFIKQSGEMVDLIDGLGMFDEVWLYNVLQHVDDPAKVLRNAKARVRPHGWLRIFEWMWIPADDCHPHVLTPELILNNLAGMRISKIVLPKLNECWCNATALAGVFSP